jgi:autoinducer 2 (AI-2) kinase
VTPPRSFIAIDIGTTGGRASLFTINGQLQAQVRWPWVYLRPPDGAPWGRTLDTDQAWQAVADGIREVLSSTGVLPNAVLAVAVASQRQGVALLDGAGTTLYAGPNIDLRGIFEGTRLLAQHGDQIYDITGHLPPYLFAPARLLWFRNHQPQLYTRVRTMLMLDGWFTWKLSGVRIAEVASAAESGLLDVAGRAWSTDLITALGLPSDIYPQLLPAGAVAGNLTRCTASQTGLAAGTPVVTAGPDTQCGILGLGAVTAGDVGIVAGWSAPVQQVVPTPIFDRQRQLWATCHLPADRWIVEANAGPAGQAYSWLGDLLVPGQGFEALDRLAAEAAYTDGDAYGPPVLASLGPRLADYNTPRLLWGGLVFPLAGGLGGFDSVGRSHIARAGLENIAFALRANLEKIRTLAGPGELPIRLGGGLTLSQVFPQVMADVLGVPVWVPDQPAVTSLGACMCAAVGAGLCGNLQEASVHMRAPGRILEPQRAAQASYLDAYERWAYIYDRLGRLSEEIG